MTFRRHGSVSGCRQHLQGQRAAGHASLWPKSHRHAAGKCLGPEDLQHSVRGWAELGETQTSQGNLLPTLRPLPHALGPLYQRLLCRSQTLDGCVELADPDLTHPGGQLGAASAHTRLCSQSGMGGKAPASRAWGRAPLRLFVSSPAWTSPPRALLPLPPAQRPLTGKTGLPIHLPTGNPRAARARQAAT